ncbi:2Fe-2S iron-sulfur cluster-binding protein [Haloarcula onubensis]|uniref:2Fe-2S iron-sulfur cluster-binding protein n=1 Tax=Haloarcula onubensis TaxID=2950539 RepID=A0ABU2FT18_9EURY|nr:2Fe-2S iron-sulfur cluster-binding protein [Halomicroarcula sp. S3CR25-11]MDS0283391.1 2Fe-2S iron-sulfur cluster-binding protein [Halomicroarcula sp. S3CR25-11]
MATLRLVWRDGPSANIEDADGPVLDAARAAGLCLPYGCRTGACGTCTGRVLAGSVTHDRPPRALKRRHRDDGYVLTCIATPEGDCTVEVGTEVKRDLLENPFK